MLKIRTHQKIDIPYRVRWLNNPKTNKFVGDILGQKTTLKKQQEWFDNYSKSKDKKFFTICYVDKRIGFMGLSNISKINKNADLFIMIGDEKYHGQGIGQESMKWLINYGFNKLKLHKINLGVIENNVQAVKLYKKLGFKIEGKMKDEVYDKGKFYDFLSMALFNKNYKIS